MTRRFAIALLLLLTCTACTEESFRRGGHDALSGLCAKSANCTVNCPSGQRPDAFGQCGLSPN